MNFLFSQTKNRPWEACHGVTLDSHRYVNINWYISINQLFVIYYSTLKFQSDTLSPQNFENDLIFRTGLHNA